MRNRIRCNVPNLTDLDSEMLQKAVGGDIFKRGAEYFSAKRVRVIALEQNQINTEVEGVHAIYSQEIHLQNGYLNTSCTCPSTDQPFCRHCVAALLEVEHASGDNGSARAADLTVDVEPIDPMENGSESGSDSEPDLRSHTAMDSIVKPARSNAREEPARRDLNFHEVGVFIDWMHNTVAALGSGREIPAVANVQSGVLRHWAGALRKLKQDCDLTDRKRRQLDALVRERDQEIVGLKKQLDATREESKRAGEEQTRLHQELERCRNQMQSARNDLYKKAAEMDALATSIKTASSTLYDIMPKNRPHSNHEG